MTAYIEEAACRRANALALLLGIVFALLVVSSPSANGAAPRERPPITVEVSSLEELRQAAEKAMPGSVIRLTARTYQNRRARLEYRRSRSTDR